MDAGKKRCAAGVLAVLSAAVLGVSLWWFAASNADLFGGLLQTTVTEEAAPAGSQDADARGEAADDGAADAADSEEVDAAGNGADGMDAEASDTARAASGGAVDGDAPAGSHGVGGGSPPANGATGGQAPSSGDAGAPAPATVTVSIAIDSSAADGRVTYSGTLTFEEGATVLDALYGTGLSVDATSYPGMGTYVAAIGGLAEKEFGGQSGWKYRVNGVEPDYSCGYCTLSDGDAITWLYVRSA